MVIMTLLVVSFMLLVEPDFGCLVEMEVAAEDMMSSAPVLAIPAVCSPQIHACWLY
jgi:hypothetical protein